MDPLADLLHRMLDRPRYYRLDGSPYPAGDEGLFEWCADFEDQKGRIVRQELLWNGIFVSTVWLGIDHNWAGLGRPIIFESMTFHHLQPDYEEEQWRYSTLLEAEAGHYAMKREVGSLRYTLRLWLQEIWNAVDDTKED